ncbi:MAG TPA: hypothetical protein IAB39_01130 [Candidatus Onthovicinus excrementipullorum]|nr:hypothetical protein [Candidatus Onthovicinus excrementipullorum]
MFHMIDSRAKKVGAAQAKCPACGKTALLQMMEVFDSLHLVCVPVGSFLEDYFAVCPECSSVFALDKTAYIALKGGNGSFINEEHMHLLVDGTKRRHGAEK